MHPAQYIPMERGEKGSSLQFNSATRLIKSLAFSCFSGTSIAPLTAQELRGTTGSPSLLTLLSLSALPKKRHLRSGMARGRLRRCRRRAAHAECCPGVRAIRRGIYPVRLLDGKLSRLRFKRDQSAPNGFEAEWRASNRNFAIPEECSIHTAVARLTAYFSGPHQVITLTAEAESWHLSYQGAMNVQSHVVRESGDVQAGARFGAAPWQVGVLAALLLVFEIFVGAHSVEALQAKALQVTSQHLQRAYAVLQLVL